jgi:riboflavin synthase alpha subunit
MFTGIIEELGTVESAGARLKVRCSTVMTDMTVGASMPSTACA